MSSLRTAFAAARLPSAVVHFDTAACGRPSTAVLEAVAAHGRHEVEVGGYVAQQLAQPALGAGRAALGALLGFGAEDVAYTESASSALASLLAAWPFPPGSSVAVASNEYGPNLAAFEDRGLEPVLLYVDGQERIELSSAASALGRVQLLHVCLVSSHRGVVQPIRELVELAHRAGVPVLVDVAQAAGHLDARTGADAVYGTSRKWLTGPRGVGFLAATPVLAARLTPRHPLLSAARWPIDLPPMHRFDSADAHIAGRVGLAVAVGELLANGPLDVFARLAAVGHTTRQALAGHPGWEVVEAAGEPTAITTLRFPADVDVAALRQGLVEIGIVTTYCGVERAPRHLRQPVLRISPHVDLNEDHLELLADAIGRTVVATR